MLSRSDLEAAAATIRRYLPATPQYCWPLLTQRLNAKAVWVKHENHLPIGAFKVRGGVLWMSERVSSGVRGVIAATRGNHGQSVAYAARIFGVRAVLVVPRGNSREKNAAMLGFGAELIEHGRDFQEAFEHASELASRDALCFVPSFSPDLVRGVASYALEFFRGAGELDVVYVAIGLGSGICGMITARDALGLTTRIVGVVAEGAPCYALSMAAGQPESTDTAVTIADGLACRVPNVEAFAMIQAGVERIVTVSDREIRAAMRHYFTDTHQVAEGAGAAGLAAALRERDALAGQRVGLVLSGGNVDSAVFADVLRGE